MRTADCVATRQPFGSDRADGDKKPSTKCRMADDKFVFCRSVSMPAIKWVIADVERVKLKASTEGQRSIPQQDPLR